MGKIARFMLNVILGIIFVAVCMMGSVIFYAWWLG